MTDKVLDPIIELVRRARIEPAAATCLGTITFLGAAGAEVQFDAEAAPSTKAYQTVGTCALGDRVLMVRAGTGWVIAGVIRTGPVIQARNEVIVTNASGIGTITYPASYPVAPVVTITPYDIAYVIRQVVPSTGVCTFEARNAAGAILNSTSIRVGWIAHPAT